MRIAAGFDHAGYPLKRAIVAALEEAGHEVVDCGTDSEQSVDYPVHAAEAAGMVADGRAEMAVLACGSGTGVSIVANKLQGVRAVNAHNPEEAEMARRHNDANVLALAGRNLSGAEAREIIRSFLAADFEGGRHQRRVDQIARIENGEPAAPAADSPASAEGAKHETLGGGEAATIV
jgi:ribose 5-phosphate isomerase B